MLVKVFLSSVFILLPILANKVVYKMSHLLDCSGLLDSGGRASPLGRPHPVSNFLRDCTHKIVLESASSDEVPVASGVVSTSGVCSRAVTLLVLYK